MIKRYNLLIFILFYIPFNILIGQDRLLKKAYIQLNESDWEDFNDKIDKYLTKGGEKSASYHYLKGLYFQKSTDYDPVKWCSELMVSFSKLKLMPQEDRISNCSAFNLCINNEKEEISKVVNALYQEYKKRNTIYYWKEFITNYGTHSLDLKYKAEKNIVELAFNAAKEDNTEISFQYFIENYPKAIEIPKAIELRNDRAFNTAKEDNTEISFQYFIETYPKAIEIPKAIELRNNLAFNTAKETNTIESFQDFIETYPLAAEIPKAIELRNDRAFNAAKETNTIESFQDFIETYPSAAEIPKAIELRYELAFIITKEQNSVIAYNDFLVEFPNTNYKELILKKIQEIEYQAVLKESEYPNGKINPIKEHLEKYPNTNNKTKLGEIYFKLISAGLKYNCNEVKLYQEFLQLFAINESQMKALAELVNDTWDLPLMEFFIKEFPFYDQISALKENRKWIIETDNLIYITEKANSLATADEEQIINIPRYAKQTENGITIQTRENIISLKNNINAAYEESYITYSYNCFLPLFKEHKIYIGLYEGFHTMFVSEKNGKKTTFGGHEDFGQNSIIFRNKKNIFFTTTTSMPYGDGYYDFSIYSYKNGAITKVFNEEFLFDEPEAVFFDKTNFSKTNRIQCSYTYQETEYVIEYGYSEKNNSWKKIENMLTSENAMKSYIEKLIDRKTPIKINGKSLKPENGKGENHYSGYYNNYYNGVCYSSLYITQRGEINSLPINYKGLIYPIKLTDENILIGTSSTEEHYYMEDYDEDELIFIDFKNAYNNKEIILPHYKLSTMKIGNLEVMTEDLGQMNWEDAQSACEALGDGWYLPSRGELIILYENKEKIGGFANSAYWSADNYDEYEDEDDDRGWKAWGQDFSDGSLGDINNTLELNVRAVRYLP